MSDTENKILWPGWETARLIGRGSFGAVYEIQRDMLGEVERAALKVISIPQNESDIEELYSDGYDDESITSTFQNHLKSIIAEYALMRKLNGCSNIVNCDDVRYVQHDDGIGWDIFIKMELLMPLTKALPADVPEETVIKLAKDMCAALELCKKHNIVHRDIKPQNIFASEHGDYKLGDFGIAKTVEKTMGGTKIGTYKYMAPEVYHNRPYGSGADIYSLGLVLYWLLNERRMPFMPLPPEKLKAGAEEEARMRRLSGEQLPPPAHGSERLKRIVLKACAYDPKQRYQSANEMLVALEQGDVSAMRPAPVITPVAEPKPVETPAPAVQNSPKPAVESVPMPAQDARQQTAESYRRSYQAQQEKQQKPQSGPSKSNPLKKWWPGIAAAVLTVILLVILLPRSCANRQSPDEPQTNQTGEVPQNTDEKPEVISMTLLGAPEGREYPLGSILDTSEIDAVSLTYADGTQVTLTSGYTSSPRELNTPGTQVITVSFQGATATFTVEVAEAEENTEAVKNTEAQQEQQTQQVTLSSIAIQSNPKKTQYYYLDELDTTGLSLKLTYSNGTTKTVSSGFTCSPQKLKNVGDQKISVTYEGKTASFSVNVKKWTITSISINTKPQTGFLLGDTFNTSGLMLDVVYDNGKTSLYDTGYTVDVGNLNMDVAGTYVIAVTLEGVSTTYEVTVSDAVYLYLSHTDVTHDVKYASNDGYTSGGEPYWVLSLPEVTVFTATGESLGYSWRVRSGEAYISGNDLVVYGDSGTYLVEAYVEHNGYVYKSATCIIRVRFV